MEYCVYLGGEEAGKATVERSGLYYLIDCRCRLSGQVICCLMADTSSGSVNLGTMVPENGYFRLKTRIPTKKLGSEIHGFAVTPKHQKIDKLFIPINIDEPFSYLEKLTDAYLVIQNNRVGISFADDDQRSISNPTGQWSEPKMSE